ncbi:unnamed protein product [Arabidopsis arenosa]|uniref:Pentatricopeptide repeat-containing protein n=1 Tax=Arabidopsis arenosa TaxID=38785 RepID=A0A8S2AMQ7_ARAAE|nr:unnamed protein product [Arabidopsis arenosa]
MLKLERPFTEPAGLDLDVANTDFAAELKAEGKLGLFFDRARAFREPIAVTLNVTAYYNGIVSTIYESMTHLLQTKKTEFNNNTNITNRLTQVSNQLVIGACITTYLKLRALIITEFPDRYTSAYLKRPKGITFTDLPPVVVAPFAFAIQQLGAVNIANLTHKACYVPVLPPTGHQYGLSNNQIWDLNSQHLSEEMFELKLPFPEVNYTSAMAVTHSLFLLKTDHGELDPSNAIFDLNHVDLIISSFLSLPDLPSLSSPLSIGCSFDRVVEKLLEASDDDSVHDRTLQLASLLQDTTKRLSRKHASLHNSNSWLLPHELTIKVFSLVDTKSLMQASACCTMFKKCANDSFCYSNIDLTNVNVKSRVVRSMIFKAVKELRDVDSLDKVLDCLTRKCQHLFLEKQLLEKQIGPASSISICGSSFERNCPNITSLSLIGFGLSDKKVYLLIKGLRKLKYLNLSRNSIIKGRFLRDVNHDCKDSLLETLILRDCNSIEERNVCQFLDSLLLVGHLRFIRHIDVSNEAGLIYGGKRCSKPKFPLEELNEERPVMQIYKFGALSRRAQQLHTSLNGLKRRYNNANSASNFHSSKSSTQTQIQKSQTKPLPKSGDSDIKEWNVAISSYMRTGRCSEALRVFKRMPRWSSVSYNAMISGYLRNDVVALELGKQLHGRLVKGGYETGCFVGNALLLMYCKCGSIEEANDLFKEMAGKDIVSWNTMIAGYSRHGFGEEALRFFESMKREGLKPDNATMVAVLSACSHTGLVDKGRQYFHTMTQDYGVTPNSQHYACMVDLLGRAGLLEEAHNLMKNMPFEPDAAIWGTLLGASRVHGNTELAETAADKIFAMEPENSGMYVLLSNLYASSGRWGDVGKLRVRMRDKGVKKVPGYSWIEIQNKTHTFSVGDEFHPEKDEIFAFLEDLDLRMKKAGYVSKTSVVLHDVEEEEKERMVRYHSERLAVAYGIMRVSSGRPIRVIKNLRVCEDCHNAIKYMAKITGRLIILRDNNRFHHFKDGSCSCGDYW